MNKMREDDVCVQRHGSDTECEGVLCTNGLNKALIFRMPSIHKIIDLSVVFCEDNLRSDKNTQEMNGAVVRIVFQVVEDHVGKGGQRFLVNGQNIDHLGQIEV